ncbi:MAG: hypothetical protein IJV96_06345 [Clostridia bacterium]|nr:hypothetical protein [Clostridia bacterium]
MCNERRRLLVSGIKASPDTDPREVIAEARRRLRGVRLLSEGMRLSVYKKSVDARDRKNVRLVYTVAAEGKLPARLPEGKSGFALVEEQTPVPTFGKMPLSARPVVVGSGPAGLFCALLLAEWGYRPVLLERGGGVEERRAAYRRFVKEGVLDTQTNIQFGAGGAGTFSDGKLVTRTRDPFGAFVLRTFVRFGAPEEILTLAKPHIGTDILGTVVEAMLTEIVRLGGEVHTHTKLLDLVCTSGVLRAVRTDRGEIPAGALVLAIGHSARDTYEMLLRHPFSVEPKAFSVGMRIEHLQADIDRAMYGDFAGHPALGHAEYTLSADTKTRGVYTFCMCPGGEVVAAASEEGGVVTNGMSYHARDGKNANAAVLASVFREDYGATPMGAIDFQRRLERAAFLAGGSDYAAPVTTVGDFLAEREGSAPSRILPTYREGGVRTASADSYLPRVYTDGIRRALRAFGRQIEGFDAPDALLTGVETRTSAPLRILRTGEYLAVGFDNVYPAGEGAGYAGGITSAAVDGVRVALALAAKFKNADLLC